jgi:hypothetical protein
VPAAVEPPELPSVLVPLGPPLLPSELEPLVPLEDALVSPELGWGWA